MFWTYLHELLHHWIHDKHDSVYFEPWVEDLCDRFATAVFSACGGRIVGSDRCGNYYVDEMRVSDTSAVTQRLESVSTGDLQALARGKAWTC